MEILGTIRWIASFRVVGRIKPLETTILMIQIVSLRELLTRHMSIRMYTRAQCLPRHTDSVQNPPVDLAAPSELREASHWWRLSARASNEVCIDHILA